MRQGRELNWKGGCRMPGSKVLQLCRQAGREVLQIRNEMFSVRKGEHIRSSIKISVCVSSANLMRNS